MFYLFIEEDFESKRGSKRESIKLWYMWNILTKDVIYCHNSKWICSSKEKLTDCISHSTNTLGKGMNPIILLSAMGK